MKESNPLVGKTTKVTVKTTIDLPEESHRYLKCFAALNGVSMREVIVDAVMLHLKMDENKG